MPVLKAAEIGHVALSGAVHQRILESPAHPGGVRPQRRRHSRRKLPRQPLQIFEHARPRPVDVRAVLEDRVDKRVTEEAVAAHHPHLGRSNQPRDDGISDLVLHQVRAPPLPRGEHDHLDIAQVGDGVQGCMPDRVNAAGQQRRRQQKNHELVARAPLDHALDQRFPQRWSRRVNRGRTGRGKVWRRRVRRGYGIHASGRRVGGSSDFIGLGVCGPLLRVRPRPREAGSRSPRGRAPG